MIHYTVSSPDKPHVQRVGQSSQLTTDPLGYVTKTDPRLEFLIGWHIDRVKSWCKYKKWTVEEKQKS